MSFEPALCMNKIYFYFIVFVLAAAVILAFYNTAIEKRNNFDATVVFHVSSTDDCFHVDIIIIASVSISLTRRPAQIN